MKSVTLLRLAVAFCGLMIISLAKAQSSGNPYYTRDTDNVARNYFYFFSSFAIPDNLVKSTQPITVANTVSTRVLVIDQIDVQVSNSEIVTFAEVDQTGPSNGITITKGITIFPVTQVPGYGYVGAISLRYILPPGDSLKVFLGRPSASSPSTHTVGTILFSGYGVSST